MRRMLALLLLVTCVVALAPPAAHAGGHGAARAAIGLATFAIFAPFIIVGEILALAVPPYRAPAVVVAPPPVYYAPAPAYSAPPPTYSASPVYVRQTYAAPAPAQPSVIQYPGGRYELRGNGIATAYQWVWISNRTISSSPLGAPDAPPAASQ